MSMNQRRATGTHITTMDKQNKSDVVFMLKEAGYKLVIERYNEGQWNEYRRFFAVKRDGNDARIAYSLFVHKGDRVDWDEMFHEFWKVA